MTDLADEFRIGWTWVSNPLLHRISVLADWCEENCQGDFDVSLWDTGFKLEQDAVLFTLKWIK